MASTTTLSYWFVAGSSRFMVPAAQFRTLISPRSAGKHYPHVRRRQLTPLPIRRRASGKRWPLPGDSDEAGQAFQYEAGHPFRDEAGHGSDLKPATWRRSPAGRADDVFVFGLGQALLIDGLSMGLARREPVPVVNRRDPRATRRAPTADAAARAGGAC
jgi:hypothetical protein